ncbi:MAG: hypothetical protein LUD27_05440 [Clostridia bacterium]|nr:hypothetical protein [Clostridia bacterium]
MAEKAGRVIRLIYNIIFSLITAALAASFIYEACDIYFGGGGGKGNFTRAVAAERLGEISVIIWLWIAAVLIGLVLYEVFPPKGKKKYGQDVRYSLYRLKKKLPVKAEGDLLEDAAKVAEYTRVLKILWGVVAAFCAIFAIAGLSYLLDADNFNVADENDSNSLIIACVIKISPYVISAFALCIGAVIYEGWGAKQQLPHVKRLVALGRKVDPSYNKLQRMYYSAVAAAESDITLWIVRTVLFVVAVVFIILGVSNGGAEGVFQKAAALCYECIGLT